MPVPKMNVCRGSRRLSGPLNLVVGRIEYRRHTIARSIPCSAIACIRWGSRNARWWLIGSRNVPQPSKTKDRRHRNLRGTNVFNLVAQFDRIWTRAGTWLLSARGQTISVLVLLLTQAGLLAYSATRHSPTHLEPAFLAAGISHWQFGRFELYRVNPPLVRMVAALPVMAVGCKMDWSRFYEGPGARAEFPLGEDFIKANGPESIPLFFYARWACIPFNLIGAFFAYRWAKELYGSGAGFVTLILYVFEPNLLAHGELITPDGACTAFGILAGYTFWRWLKLPIWSRAFLAGGALGLAELSKMSWLILFGLWPLLWLYWRFVGTTVRTNESQSALPVLFPSLMPSTAPLAANVPAGGRAELRGPDRIKSSEAYVPPLSHLVTILLLAIYLINLGYDFDGCTTPLKDFQFVSTSLTGLPKPGEVGNRFRDTWIGSLPVPLPKQYVLGFDSQKKDFEDLGGRKSYLRGEWKQGGWWYYYLYGLLLKVPCGTWGLFVIVVLSRLFSQDRPVPLRDELVLLVPAVALLTLVSSQTEFNIHLRYVFPSLGLATIFLGQSSSSLTRSFLVRMGHTIDGAATSAIMITVGLLAYSLISFGLVYPHHPAYFNEFVGGPRNGYRHLLGSSFDWGQDALTVARISEELRASSQEQIAVEYLVPGNFEFGKSLSDPHRHGVVARTYVVSRYLLACTEEPMWATHHMVATVRWLEQAVASGQASVTPLNPVYDLYTLTTE